MTIPDAPVHYDVTRVALIDALGNLPLGEHLHLEPRGRFADALLAQMPVASDAGFYMEGVKAERERCAELAEEHHAVTHKVNQEGVYGDPDNPVVIKRPFADVIRSQP